MDQIGEEDHECRNVTECGIRLLSLLVVFGELGDSDATHRISFQLLPVSNNSIQGIFSVSMHKTGASHVSLFKLVVF